MNFKPILFSTPMVQAILEDRKTMTRRVIKFPKGWVAEDNAWDWAALHEYYPKFKCPYGEPGDVLWVRETFAPIFHIDGTQETEGFMFKADFKDEHGREMTYVKDGTTKAKWKPNIFMPKEACRLFLKITDVRVERLEDISYKDAIAEGINHVIDKTTGFCGYDYFSGSYNLMTTPVSSFLSLWRKVNGLDRYAKTGNPWVWVISFERIEKPENFIS